MRIGITRTDLGKGVYLADIASAVQYPYASAVAGQSRTLFRPTDAQLASLVAANPLPVADTGTNTAANVDTNPTNVFSARTSPGSAFKTFTITSGDTTAKGTVLADLNTGFAANGLPLVASIVGTNQIRIQTTARGPSAYLEINVDGTSTLNAILGLTAGVYAAPTQAALLTALKAAVYPSATTFNVAAATIEAVGPVLNTTGSSKYNLLSDGGAAFAASVADIVAPQIVAGGDVLLSFAAGVMSKVRATTFRYKGVTGSGLYATLDDGSTAFTYP